MMCVGETVFNSFLGNVLSSSDFINGQLYIFNTGFNPQERNPIVTYLDSNFIMPFSLQIGNNMLIELGTYEIKTDTGMTPFVTEEIEEGFYVA